IRPPPTPTLFPYTTLFRSATSNKNLPFGSFYFDFRAHESHEVGFYTDTARIAQGLNALPDTPWGGSRIPQGLNALPDTPWGRLTNRTSFKRASRYSQGRPTKRT